MNKKLLLSILTAIPFAAMSQQLSDPSQPGVNPFRDDPNARAVQNTYDGLYVEGSPFLHEEYIPMEITLVQGGVFSDVKVKVNMVDNEIIFMAGGKEMATATPVKRRRYTRVKEDGSGTEQVTIESFGVPINSKGAPIYEVLADGKARLLKQIVVSYSDVRKYPEGTQARVFKKKTSYYASINNQAPVKFDKGKSEVLSLFPDKQSQVTGFVEKEKLKCKTESDLVKVFSYYSTLN